LRIPEAKMRRKYGDVAYGSIVDTARSAARTDGRRAVVVSSPREWEEGEEEEEGGGGRAAVEVRPVRVIVVRPSSPPSERRRHRSRCVRPGPRPRWPSSSSSSSSSSPPSRPSSSFARAVVGALRRCRPPRNGRGIQEGALPASSHEKENVDFDPLLLWVEVLCESLITVVQRPAVAMRARTGTAAVFL